MKAIKFILGFAGSGKSTRLAADAKPETLVLTPTHKAAGVLIAKGVKNVYTIHSTLKLVPTLNQNYDPRKKQRMQKLKKIGDTDLTSITDIFIDEFSMVSQEIFDLLLEVLPDNCKLTVFGDPYQLSPVDGLPIIPTMYTQDIEHLTVQYRAEAPEVVETFMRIMNYLKDGSCKDLSLNPAIQYGNLSSFNPETDRVLAYTNKKVGELNDAIAKVLGLDETYSVKDELVANQLSCTYEPLDFTAQELFPNCISKGKLLEESALVSKVEDTLADIHKFRTDLSMYQTATIEIEDVLYTIFYDKNHYETNKQLKADIDDRQRYLYDTYELDEDTTLKDWCRQNRDKRGVKERGKAWSAYMAHNNLVFSLQRPYTTTIHKAQGSEFSTVFIAQEDIKKSIRNGYFKTYATLMYVALSRAINKVVIV